MTNERLEQLRQIAAMHPRSEFMDELIDEVKLLQFENNTSPLANVRKWLDRLDKQIQNSQAREYRLSKTLEIVGGAAAGLLTALGLSWDGQVAKLCNVGGDLEKIRADWLSAATEARHRLAKLQCTNCRGTGVVTTHGITGEFSDQSQETCDLCDGTGRALCGVYDSFLKGFHWQLVNGDGLQAALVSPIGKTAATVYLAGSVDGYNWHTWDKAHVGGENGTDQSIEGAMRSAELATERWGKHRDL